MARYFFGKEFFLPVFFGRETSLEYGYFKGIGYEEECTGIYR